MSWSFPNARVMDEHAQLVCALRNNKASSVLAVKRSQYANRTIWIKKWYLELGCGSWRHLACFSGQPDHFCSGSKKMLHVAFEKEDIRQPAQETKRRFVFKAICHGCDALILLEKVIVIKALKGAAYHGVSEMIGTVPDSDTAREPLPYAEVSSLPGHLIVEADQPSRDSTHRFLVCFCS